MKLKQWRNTFHVTVNVNSIVQHIIKKNWNSKTCQCECKSYHKCDKNYSLNPSTCICENSNYLKSVADTSVTKCNKIVFVIKNLSTKKANTITTNVTTTALINCHSTKARDCYTLHTVLLILITLLIAISVCCYLIKYWAIDIYIININNFNQNNFKMDEKS